MQDSFIDTAPGNSHVKDTDMQGFGPDVIEASKAQPVIVDFWADWCGPCKQLMPLLEKVVNAADGAVKLVKVNADQNQALCAQMQVQSLPTVLAFWQGQPIDGFQGALPESHVKTFVDRLIQAAGGTSGGNGVAEALAQARAMEEAGQVPQAAELYQQILAADPNNGPALAALSEMSLQAGHIEGAEEALQAFDALEHKDAEAAKRADRVRAALELAALGDAGADISALTTRLEADSGDLDAYYSLAGGLIARGDMPGAAENLLKLIMRDVEWEEGKARQLLLKLFDAHGPTDPFTLKYRRRLSSILFS